MRLCVTRELVKTRSQVWMADDGRLSACNEGMISLWPELATAQPGARVRVRAWRIPVPGSKRITVLSRFRIVAINGQPLGGPAQLAVLLTRHQSHAMDLMGTVGGRSTRWLTARIIPTKSTIPITGLLQATLQHAL